MHIIPSLRNDILRAVEIFDNSGSVEPVNLSRAYYPHIKIQLTENYGIAQGYAALKVIQQLCYEGYFGMEYYNEDLNLVIFRPYDYLY